MMASIIAYFIAGSFAFLGAFAVLFSPFDREKGKCFWTGIVLLSFGYLAALAGGI